MQDSAGEIVAKWTRWAAVKRKEVAYFQVTKMMGSGRKKGQELVRERRE